MSKDPAFLFYPNDFSGGTMGMTFEQKGAYLELLIMQFNQTHFTLAQAKQVLSICFDVAWDSLNHKFEVEGENGEYFYNQRLRDEIEKRRRFTESRRLNGLAEKKKEASAKHMPKHMEDENENENLYEDFIKIVNGILKKNYRGDVKSKRQFNARLKEGITLEDLKISTENFSKQPYHIENGFNYLTPEFLTRSDKIEKGKNLVVKKVVDLSKETYR